MRARPCVLVHRYQNAIATSTEWCATHNRDWFECVRRDLSVADRIDIGCFLNRGPCQAIGCEADGIEGTLSVSVENPEPETRSFRIFVCDRHARMPGSFWPPSERSVAVEEEPIKLGDKVRDRKTGTEGVLTCITQHLGGKRMVSINQFLIDQHGASRCLEFWCDQDRVEVIDS